MLYGVATGTRVVSLLILSMTFTVSTDAREFVQALIQQWRLPYRIGYGTLAAFRFVPLLRKELTLIKDAHRVRGVTERRGLRGLVGRLVAFTTPS